MPRPRPCKPRLRVCLAAAAVLIATAPAGAAYAHAGSPAAATGSTRDRIAPLQAAAPGARAGGSYIVRLTPTADAPANAARHAVVPRLTFGQGTGSPGYSARLTPDQLERVRRDPQTLAVEENQVATTATTQRLPEGGQWGLDRIDQRQLPLSKSYFYAHTGSGVTAYVVDTGIDYSHPEFGGRASKHFDAFGGTGRDCDGHGTHVAGTIGSRTYGVAKAVRLKSVRVLNCAGTGTTETVIAGVDAVRLSHAAKSVANISIEFSGEAPSVDAAIDALYNSGVAVVVAAGNHSSNACSFAVSDARGAITVAASNRLDQHASFSNFGPCVQLYAPGLGVTSTYPGGTTASMSGTSMASPHVAGALALKLSSGPYSAGGLRAWVLSNASKNLISGEPTGTPDLLLNKTPL